MKLGNLTKAAMVVAMMMGQVTTPASDSGYYEDDGDFNAVSSVLSGGWGWGLNKAHATTCDTFEGTGQCENTGGEWDGEVIVVIGEQQDEPWGGSRPSDDSSYYEDTRSGGGGGGDDDNSDGAPTPEPTPEPTPTPAPAPTEKPEWLVKYEQCMLDDLSDKNDCLTIADGLYNASVGLCSGFLLTLGPVAGSMAAATCVAVASTAHTDQKGNCEEFSAEEQNFCKWTYPQP